MFDVPLSPFTTIRLMEENAARTVREREKRRAAIVPEVDAFGRGAGFVPEPPWQSPPPPPRLIGRRSPQLAAVEADIAFLERAHRSQLAQAQQLVARIGDHQTRMEWFELVKQVAAIALVPVSPPAALVSAVMALRDRLNLGTLGNDLEAAVLELARMGALLAAFQHVQHAVVVGLNQLSVANRAAPPCPAGTPRKCRDLWKSAQRLRSHAEELVNLRAQRWVIERFHNFARVVGVELEQSLSAVRALESDAEARCRASRDDLFALLGMVLGSKVEERALAFLRRELRPSPEAIEKIIAQLVGDPLPVKARPVADLVREVLSHGAKPGSGAGGSLPPLRIPRGALELDALMQYRLVEQGGLPFEDLSQLISQLRHRTAEQRTEILAAGYSLIANGWTLSRYDGWHARFVATAPNGATCYLPER